jgi:hypothetical protein
MATNQARADSGSKENVYEVSCPDPIDSITYVSHWKNET